MFLRKSYWVTEATSRLSHSVKSMIQLKHYLPDFMRCEIGDGKLISFWYDSWSDLGPLIELFGLEDPRQLRVRKDARLVEATRNGFWSLPAARLDAATSLQVCSHYTNTSK